MLLKPGSLASCDLLKVIEDFVRRFIIVRGFIIVKSSSVF